MNNRSHHNLSYKMHDINIKIEGNLCFSTRKGFDIYLCIHRYHISPLTEKNFEGIYNFLEGTTQIN